MDIDSLLTWIEQALGRSIVDDAGVAGHIGVRLIASEEFDQAIPFLAKAVALSPNSKSLRTQLAFAYYKIGDSEMANYHKKLANE